MSYAPRDHSLRARILAFYEANPDEELSHADILVKFQAKEKTAAQCLADMRRRGEVESVHVVRLPTKGRAA